MSYESKKVLQRLFNEYQKDFIVKLRSLRSTDPKPYWSLLNKGCDKSNTVNQKVADFSFRCFFDHLKNLNNVDNNADVVLTENVTEFNSVINEPITTDAFKSLKNNKACENDMILNVSDFFKYGSVKRLPLFVKIFDIV